MKTFTWRNLRLPPPQPEKKRPVSKHLLRKKDLIKRKWKKLNSYPKLERERKNIKKSLVAPSLVKTSNRKSAKKYESWNKEKRTWSAWEREENFFDIDGQYIKTRKRDGRGGGGGGGGRGRERETSNLLSYQAFFHITYYIHRGMVDVIDQKELSIFFPPFLSLSLSLSPYRVCVCRAK